MSSFDTIEFNVVPNNGRFPNPEIDETGFTTYTASVRFSNASHHNSMVNRVSIVTPKRNLGSRVYNVHIDYGVGPKALIVPASGGHSVTYTQAVLISFSNAEGYGRITSVDYFATLKWILLEKAVV